MVLLAGAARVDSLRPTLAAAIGVGVPAFAIARGTAPLRDSSRPLWVAGLGVALLTLAATEFLAIEALLWATGSIFALTPLVTTLATCGITAVLIEALAARRALKSRFAAWLGLAAGFSGYLAAHSPLTDALASVMAALLFGLFVTGALGFFLGLIAAAALRRV